MLDRRILLAAAAVALTCATGAQAQTAAWPAKPVRIIVGFAAGGPTDVVARAFAEHATRTLGQPFIIENKAGANSTLAADAVAGAPSDGYTLLFAATNHTMIPALYSNRVKFDAVRSFAAICSVARSPTVLVVGPAMPVRTLAAFQQQVKEQPGRRTYATPGAGSSGHFATESFLRPQGLSMNHIPYKGAAPAITDLIGGQVDSSFATLGSVLPYIQAGKLQALAVAAPRRSPLLPDVPTFEEAGGKGYSADAWYGLLAPVGTPSAVVASLEKLSAQFVATPGTATKLNGLGLEAESNCGAPFAALLERDVRTYTQIARDLNLKAE